jgi:hypothetical protein
MAWLRIDDRVRTHPKIASAGPTAAWVWFCGVCYCREHLTDGLIPHAILATLVPGLKEGAVRKQAAILVRERLWHEADGGFRVHDFLDWNPTKAKVLEQRECEKDKKARQRGGVPEGQGGDTVEGHTGDSYTRGRDRAQDARGAGLGSGSSSAADALKPGESKTSTAIARRGYGGGALSGMLPREHLRHAWCGERICVPDALHADFQRRIGGNPSDADGQLRLFYQRVHNGIPPGPFGDDAFDFWRKAFAAAFPSVAPQGRQQKTGLIDRMRASDEAATAMLDSRGRS